MKVYRIYTENKNLGAIKKNLSKTFEGYTIIKTSGIWKGKEEESIIIEIVSSNPNELSYIQAFAETIKRFNQQDSVLITANEVLGVIL
jgi:hypothetical protein